MNVFLNSITGMEDGIATLYFSKRSWDPVKDNQLRMDWRSLQREFDGFSLSNEEKEGADRCEERIKTFCKYAWEHTAMLDFITISVCVEGMHRAGQDDWDAHAKRYDNRIIRSSTRLADFQPGEMSDWYKGKIIPTDIALGMMGVMIPDQIFVNDENGNPISYVKATNGYIRQDLKDDRDVKRGLYMQSIPSNFIFKCNMAQWAHVYKLRNINTSAHPEGKELAETIQDLIEEQMPWFNREFIMSVKV